MVGCAVACWPLTATLTGAIDPWSSTDAIWLSLTLPGDISGPPDMCWMVHRILKYRTTQSATGVLSAGVIFSFSGEMTGELLLPV